MPGDALTPFIDPVSGDVLIERNGALISARTGASVAPIVGGIPRFVDRAENYAEAFGFQWNTWRTLSDALHKGAWKIRRNHSSHAF